MVTRAKRLRDMRAMFFQVDDRALKAIRNVLKGRNIEVIEEKTLRGLKTSMKMDRPDFLFIGSGYLVKKGAELLTSIKKGDQSLSVIITATMDEREILLPYLVEDVSGLLLEPYHPQEILFVLDCAYKVKRAEIQGVTISEFTSGLSNPHKVYIGRSLNSQEVRKNVLRAKKDGGPVLISGEDGTGKNQVSFSIHFKGGGIVTPVRIYDPLTEPERRRGLTRYLEGLPPSGTLVVKNIHKLKAQEISRLDGMVRESQERKGRLPRLILHHNLSFGAPVGFENTPFSVTINILPLRERREDIIPISTHFIKSFSTFLNIPGITITPSARKVLKNYPWPGNVLELLGVTLSSIVNSGAGLIYPFNLPDFVTSNDPYATEHLSLETLLSSKIRPLVSRMNLQDMEGLYHMVINRVELSLIKMVLKETDGNQSKTAKILGMNRNTLKKKIEKHDINN